MKKIRNIVLLVLALASAAAHAQNAEYRQKVNSGNSLYEAEKFDEAEVAYRKALENQKQEKKVEAQFTLGNALFKQERYDEA